jgi:hypothetical protein
MTTEAADNTLYEKHQLAERRFGEARAQNLSHRELLPFLIEANEAWRACYVPKLQKRTEEQEHLRRLALEAISCRLEEMTEEERSAVRLVFGIT